MNEGDKRDWKILSYVYTGMITFAIGIFLGAVLNAYSQATPEEPEIPIPLMPMGDINQSISAEVHGRIVIDGTKGDSIKVELQRDKKYDIKISGAEDSSIELTFDTQVEAVSND